MAAEDEVQDRGADTDDRAEHVTVAGETYPGAASASSRHHEEVAYCDLCEMDQDMCVHGLADKQKAAAVAAEELLISPKGVVHFAGCPHKGDHPDYSRWATLATPRAWQRLGNGELLQATGGDRPNLLAKSRCDDCVSHGPW